MIAQIKADYQDRQILSVDTQAAIAVIDEWLAIKMPFDSHEIYISKLGSGIRAPQIQSFGSDVYVAVIFQMNGAEWATEIIPIEFWENTLSDRIASRISRSHLIDWATLEW